MNKLFIVVLLFLSSNFAYSFENHFALSANAAQLFLGGFGMSAEYNPNNWPVSIEGLAAYSRERPGDDLIEQSYMGFKINYNISGLSGFDEGFIIRSGFENVTLKYYWDNKSNCISGCPGDNYLSKKGSSQFTRYNLGVGVQSKAKTDWKLFGRENFILFRAAIDKNFSDRNEVDAVDRNGHALKEKLAQFDNYSLFINFGLIF